MKPSLPARPSGTAMASRVGEAKPAGDAELAKQAG